MSQQETPERTQALLDQRCRRCGQTLKRLMLLAMLQDAGASCSPSALSCGGDGEHDFSTDAEGAR